MKEYSEDDVLMHYGVLGMRWGVRKDRRTGVRKGTPTKGTRAAQRKATRAASEDHARSRELAKKKTRTLSNKELRQLNERVRLEKEYKELTTRGKSKNNKSLSKRDVATIAVPALANLLYELGPNPGAQAVGEVMKNYGGLAVDILFPDKNAAKRNLGKAADSISSSIIKRAKR